MAAVPSGADDLANALLVSLTEGVDFEVPEIDLDSPEFDIPPATGAMYDPIVKLTTADLTTGTVGGTGVFDQLMVSLSAHLKVEFTANRIAGAEYTKAYIGVIGAALQTSQQYLLAKDQAYWAAILVQQQARVAEIEVVKARVELETAKAMLIRTQYEAYTAEAQYGLTKMQIANADAAYAMSIAQAEGVTYTNVNLLPAQLANTEAQTAGTEAQTEGIIYTNLNLLPVQKAGAEADTAGKIYTTENLLPAQLAQLEAQTEGVVYTNTNILPAQKLGIDYTNTNLQSTGEGIEYTTANILPAQKTLLAEQAEVQNAQVSESPITGGGAISGLIGRQKLLYEQQVTSYKRDAETKLAKQYTDAWLTQKTVEEGYPLPWEFSNDSIGVLLADIREKLDIEEAPPEPPPA